MQNLAPIATVRRGKRAGGSRLRTQALVTIPNAATPIACSWRRFPDTPRASQNPRSPGPRRRWRARGLLRRSAPPCAVCPPAQCLPQLAGPEPWMCRDHPASRRNHRMPSVTVPEPLAPNGYASVSLPASRPKRRRVLRHESCGMSVAFACLTRQFCAPWVLEIRAGRSEKQRPCGWATISTRQGCLSPVSKILPYRIHPFECIHRRQNRSGGHRS